jgi:chromosome segregation ATPase
MKYSYPIFFFLLRQTEGLEYKQKLEDTEKEVTKLKMRLSSRAPVDSPEDAQLTELRFDKEALENKLRKFLSHSQRLEEEKASILDVLRSSQEGSAVFDGDISKSVISLCDKLASLEEECESLSKSENQASFYLQEVEQLREVNNTMQSQISESRKRVDRLVRSEIELKEALGSLRSEQDELRLRADRAQGTAESVETEKSRQVRFLEQENLQLLIDHKAIKKQLQNAKAELNMLRAKALDDDTMDISGLPAPTPNKARIRAKVPVERAPPKTPTEKENSENVENVASAKRTSRGWGSSLKARRTPGLGESLTIEKNEENTQECKQS